jgi:flavin-dependent dehydrogenase
MTTARTEKVDVLVVGAGPAGSTAGAWLVDRGHSVLCVDRSYFPRYVIGESLLPRCTALLREAGMLEPVAARGYMVKLGAVFLRGEQRERTCFADSLEGDLDYTFHVPRDDFDLVLATTARRRGVDLRFGHEVEAVDAGEEGVAATVVDLEVGERYRVEASFLLDCSGYGRVLPRLFDLERPAALPERVSCFTMVLGDRRPTGEQEGDIWICSHPDNGWIWIIPFADGRTSVGLVCDPDAWEGLEGNDRERLFTYMKQEPNTAARLSEAVPCAPTRLVRGYSKKVERMHGPRWALVGNATDFLDPVFSSGVTLAMETAVLAAKLTDRTLAGEAVDWAVEYDAVVDRAVDVFLAFIESWYSGELPAIFFAEAKPPRIKRRITSILGGHVLRTDNPMLRDSQAALREIRGSLPGG